MTASAEKRQGWHIEFIAAWVERMEERAHDIDGIIEEAVAQEILYVAERMR